MPYIDGFIAPVRTEDRDRFVAWLGDQHAVFKEYGADVIVDAWEDDVPPGEVTSFPLAVQAGPDETVVIGWQEWPSKAAQEAGMPKAMQDPRMAAMQDMPADGKRLIFGGFEVVLDI